MNIYQKKLFSEMNTYRIFQGMDFRTPFDTGT